MAGATVRSEGGATFTLHGAAKHLGCSTDTIRRAIKAGKLEAKPSNRPWGGWSIAQADLDAFAQDRPDHVQWGSRQPLVPPVAQPPAANVTPLRPPEAGRITPEVRALLATAQEALASAQARIDSLEADKAHYRQLLDQAGQRADTLMAQNGELNRGLGELHAELIAVQREVLAWLRRERPV